MLTLSILPFNYLQQEKQKELKAKKRERNIAIFFLACKLASFSAQ